MNLNNILTEVASNNHSAFFYTPSYYKKSKSYLFQNPLEIISVKKNDNIQKKFKEIDENIAKGLWCYALINYEAGYLFEGKLKRFLDSNDEILIQFIFFDEKDVEIIPSKEIEFSHDLGKYKIKKFKLDTSKRKFASDIIKIKKFIEEGDTYQVNYTIKGNFSFSGDVKMLFQTLVFNQSASYSAFINNSEKFILCHSPELFFETNRRSIIVKPMKGTAKRGIDLISDNLNKYTLENDAKNKSENLMIVDLLRNDLGRISKYGKVKASKLFEIEKYESLYQMVSTVKAELRNSDSKSATSELKTVISKKSLTEKSFANIKEKISLSGRNESKIIKRNTYESISNISLTEILKNIFPCGSITGAPKIRTMEIINQLEQKPRGIYTGAIGIVTKKFCSFNVAIRTITIDKKTNQGEIGLGSGIVWDSEPEKEYAETLLKSNFIRKANSYFEIFETMLVENNKIFLLDEHIDRLKSSAEYFLFKLDEKNSIK